jgi:hypothetical protein
MDTATIFGPDSGALILELPVGGQIMPTGPVEAALRLDDVPGTLGFGEEREAFWLGFALVI